MRWYRRRPIKESPSFAEWLPLIEPCDLTETSGFGCLRSGYGERVQLTGTFVSVSCGEAVQEFSKLSASSDAK